MCREWVTNSKRKCEGKPRTHACLWADEYVTCANSAVFKREEFASVTKGISGITEEVLGATFMGERVFLRDCRSGERGNDQKVYRESGGGRRELQGMGYRTEHRGKAQEYFRRINPQTS